MKRKFILSSLMVLLLAGGLGVSRGEAAQEEKQPSEGWVGFTTPANGGLSLVQVADLDFGNHPISGVDEVYGTVSDTYTTVEDLRGTETGWSLLVAEMGPFMNQGHELTRAEITLVTPLLAPTSTAVTHVKKDLALTPDGEAQVVMFAQKAEGNGVATEWFGKNKATLRVPGETIKLVGQYTTTLNWTLLDGVGND